MALRVLLADESSTIKKVMQLALQDFAVEVKAVPIGLDVLQVARSFNPDIVFADVLLSKKNGYEVSAELKMDPGLRKTPVVLMWSGFMELDEAKAQACRADRRLEKPFDAETLRSLVKELVPALGGNLISNFLSFPEMPEMVEDGKQAPQDEPEEIQLVDFNKTMVGTPVMPPPTAKSTPAAPKPTAPPTPPAKPKASIPLPEIKADDIPNFDEMEEPEEFQSVPLPKNQGLPPTPAAKSAPKDDWARQDLSKYKIELPEEDSFSLDDEDLTKTSIALSSGIEEISLDEIDEPMPKAQTRSNIRPGAPSKTFSHEPLPPSPQPTPAASSTSAPSPAYGSAPLASFDPMRAEEILRQEARSVLESVAWKLLPEIVERVVREELQKLLKDAERL